MELVISLLQQHALYLLGMVTVQFTLSTDRGLWPGIVFGNSLGCALAGLAVNPVIPTTLFVGDDYRALNQETHERARKARKGFVLFWVSLEHGLLG